MLWETNNNDELAETLLGNRLWDLGVNIVEQKTLLAPGF